MLHKNRCYTHHEFQNTTQKIGATLSCVDGTPTIALVCETLDIAFEVDPCSLSLKGRPRFLYSNMQKIELILEWKDV